MTGGPQLDPRRWARTMPAGVVLLVLGLLVVACAPDDAARQDRGALTVFAAASLTDVLEGLGERWLLSDRAVPLVIALGASNVLAAQISEGAPADVFLSADTRRPLELAAAGHTATEPAPFARNRLTLAVPLTGSAVASAEDLAATGVRLVAAGPGVPVTVYAEAAIEQLAATTSDPQAFLARVAGNVVSREDNVRAALAKVELGEGDVAVVYRTDARSSGLVREIPFPPAVDVSATYAAVRLSDHPAAADFLEWLGGPDAGEVLAAYGFEPVDA